MIALGVVLLIIGFIAHVGIIWTLGIILVVIGAVLALLGMTGRQVGDGPTGTDSPDPVHSDRVRRLIHVENGHRETAVAVCRRADARPLAAVLLVR